MSYEGLVSLKNLKANLVFLMASLRLLLILSDGIGKNFKMDLGKSIFGTVSRML